MAVVTRDWLGLGMWMLLAVCVALQLGRVAGQEDEFGERQPVVEAGMEGASASATGSSVPLANLLAGSSGGAPPTPRDWTVEFVAAAAAVVFVIGYVRGRITNSRLASAVSTALQPVLRANFSKVSTTALTSTGAASYELWATGRRHVKGLLVELTMRNRQDIATSTLSSILPKPPGSSGGALPSGPEVDTLVVEVPLEDEVEPFIVAAYPVKSRAEVEERCLDLVHLPQRYVAAKEVGLPSHVEILADASDLARLAIPPVLAAALPGTTLKMLHITDRPMDSGMPTQTLSNKVLRLEATLPAQPSDVGPAAVALVQGVLAAVDAIASATLSHEVKHRVTANRAEYQRKLDAEKAAETAEKLRAKRLEDERKAEEARVAAMDRETRRKYEIAQRKKALDAAQPKMKVMRA